MKIFILLVVFFIIFNYAEIKLDIENFEEKDNSKKTKHIANLGVYLFGVIKIINMNLRKDGIHFLFLKFNYKKINKNRLDKKTMKLILKNWNWKIEKMNFSINIGSENVELTVFLVFLISTFFSIFSGIYKKRINIENYSYCVIPIYNKNIVEYKISIIVSSKIIHLIKVLFALKNISKKKVNQLNYC